MNVIAMNDIRKSYGGTDAKTEILKGVSLSIAQGELVAITGPSGSGKSTLMNIVGLLDVPDSGTFSFCGFDIPTLKDASLAKLRLRYLGFVFQSFNLIPGLSAVENVELPMVYNRQPRQQRHKRAVELLESVGLADRVKNKPSQLSGGQQQRVAIARALANQPPIILADEPTGNLDTKTGEEVMAMLKALHAQGTTIILVTHDPHIARQADRVIAIQDGQIFTPSPRPQPAPPAISPAAPPSPPRPAIPPPPEPVFTPPIISQPVPPTPPPATPAPKPPAPQPPAEPEVVISIDHSQEER